MYPRVQSISGFLYTVNIRYMFARKYSLYDRRLAPTTGVISLGTSQPWKGTRVKRSHPEIRHERALMTN